MGDRILFWCHALATIAGVAATVSAGIALVRSDLDVKVRHALAACVIAAIPGIAFVEHAFISYLSGSSIRPYDLFSFGPAAFWILVGPAFVVWSFWAVRPLRAPMLVDGLRLMLTVGWMAASVVTAIFAVQV